MLRSYEVFRYQLRKLLTGFDRPIALERNSTPTVQLQQICAKSLFSSFPQLYNAIQMLQLQFRHSISPPEIGFSGSRLGTICINILSNVASVLRMR